MPPSCRTSDRLPCLKGWRIWNSHLELIQMLQRGAYGDVYLAVDCSTSSTSCAQYAVKCMRRAEPGTHQAAYQRREIALHRQACRHPGVVRLYETVEDADVLFLVFEYCSGGDLYSAIENEHIFFGRDIAVRNVFLQLLDAMEYCHSQDVFHRDIKPENILVAGDGRRLLFTDFGLGTDDRASRDYNVGSEFYMSPECYATFGKELPYNTRYSDLWSLGIILINLAVERNPWAKPCSSDPMFRRFLRDPEFLRETLPITDDCFVILRSILALDPFNRVSVARLRSLVEQCSQFALTEEEGRKSPHQAVRDLSADLWEAAKFCRGHTSSSLRRSSHTSSSTSSDAESFTGSCRSDQSSETSVSSVASEL